MESFRRGSVREVKAEDNSERALRAQALALSSLLFIVQSCSVSMPSSGRASQGRRWRAGSRLCAPGAPQRCWGVRAHAYACQHAYIRMDRWMDGWMDTHAFLHTQIAQYQGSSSGLVCTGLDKVQHGGLKACLQLHGVHVARWRLLGHLGLAQEQW